MSALSSDVTMPKKHIWYVAKPITHCNISTEQTLYHLSTSDERTPTLEVRASMLH